MAASKRKTRQDASRARHSPFHRSTPKAFAFRNRRHASYSRLRRLASKEMYASACGAKAVHFSLAASLWDDTRSLLKAISRRLCWLRKTRGEGRRRGMRMRSKVLQAADSRQSSELAKFFSLRDLRSRSTKYTDSIVFAVTCTKARRTFPSCRSRSSLHE